MDPVGKKTTTQQNHDPEVDLGQVFSKVGGTANRILYGFQLFIKKSFNTGVELLLYIKRNLIWLLAGTAIGLIYGFYIQQVQGDLYKSSLVVKTNFNSSRNLYETVDYFNSLISASNIKEISRLLNINETDASKITHFEAQPIKSELIIAELYQNTFLDKEFGRRPRMDTFWIRNVNYEKFRSSLTTYDFPIHEIVVQSSNPEIFTHIENGTITQIANSQQLQNRKLADITLRKQEIELLNESIKSLDSLKKVYNKRLNSLPLDQTNPGITILGSSYQPAVSVPELELYDKLLELNEELKISTKKYLANDDIIQIYQPFSPVGQKDSIFKQNITKYSLIGLISTFIVLLGISLFRYLSLVEKQKGVKYKS